MRLNRTFRLCLWALFLAGCSASTPVCTPDPLPDQGAPSPETAARRLDAGATTQVPAWVEIGGNAVQVDQIVSGSLCGGAWQGTVYVACEAKVSAWEGEPLFLSGCDLDIAPDAVVYVAAHNDQAFYKGCSCHTGEGP